MMKKFTLMLWAIVLLLNVKVIAQSSQDCAQTYNLFKGEVQTKKYDVAYPKLLALMNDCPKLSVNIYKLGDKLAKAQFKTVANKAEYAELIKRIYDQRLQYFKKDEAKVHSDYATFLIKNKLATADDVFPMLQKAYDVDPSRMGVVNIYRYFQGVTDRNKDSNPQKVFDTYDDVLESVGKKLEYYAKKIVPIKAKLDNGETLEKRDKNNLRAYTINSKSLGMVEAGLDNMIIDLSTCERLVPLYNRDFEANKANALWLSRSVSRMFSKGCTDEPLYEKLVEAWVAADPSPKTTVYFAGILYKKGKESEAMEYYKKAVDQEPDALEKAKNQYKIAQLFAKKGRKTQARNYARQALRNNPNFGKAYLLIASLYASSANQCGTTEFDKRMVYTAALKMARRAANVDPSISVKARKYIKNYLSQEPSKKLIFTKGIKPGTPHQIKCWIGETVNVPQK
jgi:tetratricopeptide (TPR) repeat protein